MAGPRSTVDPFGRDAEVPDGIWLSGEVLGITKSHDTPIHRS